MNRRELIKAALGIVAAAGSVKIAAASEEGQLQGLTAPKDTLCMAATITFTKTEVEQAIDMDALIGSKVANMRDSLLWLTAVEIKKRRWRQ